MRLPTTLEATTRLLTALVLGLGATACEDGGDEAEDSGAPSDGGELPDEPGGDFTDGAEDALPLPCITDTSAGLHQFVCPGTTRPVFVVSVPERCASQSCGLIVDVPGGGMTADQIEARTHLRELGEERGYVVVQPNAGGRSSEGTLMRGTFDETGADDDRILAFIQEAVAAFGVSPRRVHMTGFSNGGFMTWRFICRHADVLASAAPSAAAHGSQYNLAPRSGRRLVGCAFSGADQPAEEVDILFMHGRRDECFRFASESDEPDSAEDQRDAIVAAWGLGEEETVSASEHHTHLRYTGPSGTVLEVLWHDYEKGSTRVCDSQWRPDGIFGHCIPGGLNAQGGNCDEGTAFRWGEEVIRFFDAHGED